MSRGEELASHFPRVLKSPFDTCHCKGGACFCWDTVDQNVDAGSSPGAWPLLVCSVLPVQPATAHQQCRGHLPVTEARELARLQLMGVEHLCDALNLLLTLTASLGDTGSVVTVLD